MIRYIAGWPAAVAVSALLNLGAVIDARSTTVDQASDEVPTAVAQAAPHPCQDGRFSDGRPRSCEELLRWLEDGKEHEFRGPRAPYRPTDRPTEPHPCTDGRFSDGRPRSCPEMMRWLRGSS